MKVKLKENWKEILLSILEASIITGFTKDSLIPYDENTILNYFYDWREINSVLDYTSSDYGNNLLKAAKIGYTFDGLYQWYPYSMFYTKKDQHDEDFNNTLDEQLK